MLLRGMAAARHNYGRYNLDEELERELKAVELEAVADDIELDDVPATVVEVLPPEELTQRSGVVAIVPWERPGMSFWARLWSTARLATISGESFFQRFPSGDVNAALRFAVSAELLAVSGLLALSVGLGALLAPSFAEAVWQDEVMRSLALRGVFGGIPTIAVAMILLHGIHGLALDAFARRAGRKGRWAHAVRFGLYACGWDLVSLPLGLLALAFTDGPKVAFKALGAGLAVPSRASSAFLRGIYGMEEDEARAAQRNAVLVSVVTLIVAVGLAVAAVSTALVG